MDKKRIIFCIPPELHKQIKNTATDRDETMQSLILRAIAKELEESRAVAKAS